jgi:hypothetical protein
VKPTPLFTGRVLQGGLLVLDRPKDYAKHLRSLAGQYVEIVARKRRSKRSLDQNAWWWGKCLPLIAEELGYDKHDHDALHYALVAKCFGTHMDPKLNVDVPNARSSQLSTAEFSELMEWVVRWAATEYGIVIPLPNEVAA